MASQTCRGQALIELTLVVTLITLFVGLGSQAAVMILKNFRHNHLVPAQVQKFSQEVEFSRNLVFFKQKPVDQLKREGWHHVKTYRDINESLQVFERENEAMVLHDHLGVKACLRNCARN